MSTFTRFSGEEQLVFNKAASLKAKKNLWAIVPGYRYYLGHKDSDDYVDIETGFLTDGATIPRFAWWLLPPIDEYTQCTSLHDKLCTTYYILRMVNGVETKVPVNRKQIDAILKESMDVLDVTPWKKNIIMFFVNAHRIIKNPTKPKAIS